MGVLVWTFTLSEMSQLQVQEATRLMGLKVHCLWYLVSFTIQGYTMLDLFIENVTFYQEKPHIFHSD